MDNDSFCIYSFVITVVKMMKMMMMMMMTGSIQEYDVITTTVGNSYHVQRSVHLELYSTLSA